MKFQIASLALIGSVYGSICEDVCGDNFCDDGDVELNNWVQAGFDSVEECEAHACNKFSDDDGKWHECERGARELEGRKYNHILKMSRHLMTTKLSLKQLHRKLQNYGCHCFPGQTRSAGGHGPAVDVQDGLCRDLSRCHRCISMQYGSDTIDVDFAKYRFTAKNGIVDCQKTTDRGFSQAHRDLCECDAHFARELAKVWDDESFNDYFWLNPSDMRKKDKGKLVPDVPKFDIDATCVGQEGGKADECCGTYPLRHPYNSDEKDCCNSETIYNSITNVCCPGGEIGTPGDC